MIDLQNDMIRLPNCYNLPMDNYHKFLGLYYFRYHHLVLQLHNNLVFHSFPINLQYIMLILNWCHVMRMWCRYFDSKYMYWLIFVSYDFIDIFFTRMVMINDYVGCRWDTIDSHNYIRESFKTCHFIVKPCHFIVKLCLIL